jgi:hypothetical protein
MRPIRSLRWSGLLVLPLLVGARLLMHGLDARVHIDPGPETHRAPAATAGHPGGAEASDGHDDEHCPTCAAGHVMVACVAIVTAVAGLVLLRRAAGRVVATLTAPTDHGVRLVHRVLRPPEPAWVRLAVMRC